MASKKKEKKDNGKKGEEEIELGYRELMSEELFSQWQVNDELIQLLLNKSIQVVRDKEIASKIPSFSVYSTVSTMRKAIGMKEFTRDERSDDIYICAEDGEEFLPPPDDNIG